MRETLPETIDMDVRHTGWHLDKRISFDIVVLIFCIVLGNVVSAVLVYANTNSRLTNMEKWEPFLIQSRELHPQTVLRMQLLEQNQVAINNFVERLMKLENQVGNLQATVAVQSNVLNRIDMRLAVPTDGAK